MTEKERPMKSPTPSRRASARTATIISTLLVAAAPPVLSTRQADAAPSPSDAIEVTMGDYAYKVSGPLKSGGTIRYRNTGKEAHVAVYLRLRPGKTLADVQTALASDKPDALASVGEEVSLPGAMVSPGHEVAITVPTLKAGTYVLICFIPAETDGKPHFMKGMISQITVAAVKAKASAGDVKFDVTPGKGIIGPNSLKAGKHTFDLRVGPGGAALEPLLLAVPNGETVASIATKIDAIFATADKGAMAKGSGAKLAKLLVFAGFDFKETRTASFGVNLKPGNYILAAVDNDKKPLPDPIREQITIKVT